MALLLRLKTTTKPKPHSLHHLFSTAANGGNDDGDKPPSNSSSSFADSIRDLRSSLKQKPSSNTLSSPLFSSNSQNTESIEDILSKVQSFSNRRSSDYPSSPSVKQPISFQEIYYNKMNNRTGESTENTGSEASKSGGGVGGEKTIHFGAIRESLMNLKSTNRTTPPSSRLRPSMNSNTSNLPEAVFGREMKERLAKENVSFTFRTYMHNELGEKLRKLRPQVKGKEWFSIAELNERLKKVREMDEIEDKSNPNPNGILSSNLKDCLASIEAKNDTKPKKPLFRTDMLSLMGGTPTYLTKPPKEHLVEKYFHPDNMSSAEKMKLELMKVRDEFKMSESDCGSSRVQVAILTTKIKHLSSVLHKKDVHSRKGLIAMVQKRKKLLKYLRRTDWDSYCFVISKLGLRDNPEHSYKARTGKAGEVAN